MPDDPNTPDYYPDYDYTDDQPKVQIVQPDVSVPPEPLDYSEAVKKAVEKRRKAEEEWRKAEEEEEQKKLEQLPPEQRQIFEKKRKAGKELLQAAEEETALKQKELEAKKQALLPEIQSLKKEESDIVRMLREKREEMSKSKPPEPPDPETTRKRILMGALILAGIAGVGALLAGKRRFGAFIGGLGLGLQALVKGQKEQAKEAFERAHKHYQDWLKTQEDFIKNWEKILRDDRLSARDKMLQLNAIKKEAGVALKDLESVKKMVGGVVRHVDPLEKQLLKESQEQKEFNELREEAVQQMDKDNPDIPLEVKRKYVYENFLPNSALHNKSLQRQRRNELDDKTYIPSLRQFFDKGAHTKDLESRFRRNLRKAGFHDQPPGKQSKVERKTKQESEQLNRVVVDKLPENPAIGLTKDNKERTILRTMEIEGFKSHPYMDSDGKLHIGYGTYARSATEYFPDDAMGREAAAYRLVDELTLKANTLREFIGNTKWGLLTPEQRYALVDLAYHFGEGRMRDIINAVSRNDKELVAKLLTSAHYLSFHKEFHQGFAERARWRRSLWESAS
jgi:GH24 family phage-related lysozyme (muramidase)